MRHQRGASGAARAGAARGTAVAFLFCGGDPAGVPLGVEVLDEVSPEEQAEDRARPQLQCLVTTAKRARLGLMNLAQLLPPMVAVHYGLTAGPVSLACMPLAVPFSVPQVSPASWTANKRARAFHRCCVLGVYMQGALAVMKFAHGDLVGGTYDALQAAVGAFAVQPDGIRFFPTYIMISGFNGVLGILQAFQSYQGVPLHFLPILSYAPPALLLFSGYCGWQFVREIRAIAAGQAGDGPQDTCLVRFMGGDCWPISYLSSVQDGEDPAANRRTDHGSGLTAPTRFSAFGGGGHRLGES